MGAYLVSLTSTTLKITQNIGTTTTFTQSNYDAGYENDDVEGAIGYDQTGVWSHAGNVSWQVIEFY